MSHTHIQKLLVVASTLPASPKDPVPAFVSDQLAAIKKLHPELTITVLAPHDNYSKTVDVTERDSFTERRFHYFWPHRFELLAGRGIVPALKAHKWLYAVIPFLFLFEMIAIYKQARKERPDLIYVHWFTPQAVCAAPIAKLLGIPLVFTTHASDVSVWKIIPGGKQIIRWTCRQSTAYSAVSEQTADRLRHFWPASPTELEAKMSIIPMGTSVDVVKPANDPYAGKQVITYIGRIVERKGIADLITAFVSIYKKNPNTMLVIAGDGQERQRFETMAQKAGLADGFVFPGYVSGTTKDELLARTDILCLPSINDGMHAEGLPVVFMEGLVSGKIIIASDVTGAQEHITSGVNGFITPQRDPESLAKNLQQALTLTPKARQNMQHAARELGNAFSWPKVAEQQYTVLDHAYHSYHATKP